MSRHTKILMTRVASETFDSDSVPIGIDTCTSATLSGQRSDFVGKLEPVKNVVVRGVGGSMPAVARGTLILSILDDLGHKQKLTVEGAYYVPRLKLRLFSPQQWSKQGPRGSDGEFLRSETTSGDKTILHFPGGRKTVPLDARSNLPLMHTQPGFDNFAQYVTTQSLRTYEARIMPTELELLEEIVVDKLFKDVRTTPINANFDVDETSTKDSPNLNDLSEKHKKGLLLRWHYRLGHLPFDVIKNMAKHDILPRSLADVEPPLCAGCQYGKGTRRQWKTKPNKKLRNRRRHRFKKAEAPGDIVSVDTLSAGAVPGLMHQWKGKATTRRQHYATVFVDVFSGLDYVHVHEENTAAEIITAKQAFEKFANSCGVRVKHYHCDNGRFAETGFKDACTAMHQTVSFCGVNAHHQNGIAERRIRDLQDTARSMLLTAKHNWPNAITSHLWGFALKYASEIHRNAAREGGKSPLELFSNTMVGAKLTDYHTFGCPVYVLENSLQQQNRQTTKWEERTRIGIYLGTSSEHASTILNTETGLISPQFHVKHDDRFETVKQNDLVKNASKWKEVTGIERSATEKKMKRLLSSIERKKRLLEEMQPMQESGKRVKAGNLDPLMATGEPTSAAQREQRAQQSSSLGVDQRGQQAMEGQQPSAAQREQRAADQPNAAQREQRAGNLPSAAQREQQARSQMPSQRETASQEPSQRETQGTLPQREARAAEKRRTATQIDNDLRTAYVTHAYKSSVGRQMHQEEVREDGEFHPLTFASSMADNDTMYLHEAMKQDDRDEFVKAMEKEVDDHESRDHWTVVPLSEVPKGHRVLRAVWSMKRKRRVATGEVYKWKARLCVDGSKQVKNVNYWDTFSPVVSWETLRTVLTLALTEGWHTRQIDFVLAFPQADVECELYMEIPRMCDVEGDRKNHVLRLNKNLYGTKQAGLIWFRHLVKGLKNRGFEQSSVDECLFYKGNVIFVLYVDDGILLGPDDGEINDVIKSLKEDFTLTDEGDLNEYLGIKIEKSTDGTMKLIQPTLIERILTTVGMKHYDDVRTSATPATKIVHRDLGGLPRQEEWDYRSVVGMLNFLTRSTRPDLSFAVSQAARFMANPKRSHELAVLKICKYLLGTHDKGMYMKPKGRSFQVYADADFAGAYNKHRTDDVDTSRSRAAYHIMYNGCLIYWSSKLMNEICLSTTEAEYVCLSEALRTTIQLMRLMKEF